MGEQRCRRCGGTGEILIGASVHGRFITCTYCQGEGSIETHEKREGTTRDTSYSPSPQRGTQTF